jgi:hypothetical protein
MNFIGRGCGVKEKESRSRERQPHLWELSDNKESPEREET